MSVLCLREGIVTLANINISMASHPLRNEERNGKSFIKLNCFLSESQYYISY